MKVIPVIISFIILLLVFSCKEEDVVAPVVQLNGDAVVTIALNGIYTEEGATANDNLDGVVEVYISGEVNTDMEGVYAIEYTAIDADGNTGAATRTILVRNDARILSGFYSALGINPADTLYYSAELTTSVTINNRIWFRGFGHDSTAVVFAAVDNDSLDIPLQPDGAFSGKFYRGSGVMGWSGDTLKLEIQYSDSLGVIVNNGILKYFRY